MHRRALLSAATAATVALAGCSEVLPDLPREPTPADPQTDQPEPRTTEPESELDALAEEWGFEEAVDLGTRGADPTGEEPLGPILDDVAADGRLLYLPTGRYLLDGTWFHPEFSSFGLVSERATIVPPEGFDSQLFALGVPGRASRVVVSGLEFDFRAEKTGGRPIVARVDDELTLQDVTVRGRQDVSTDAVRVDVASPDGTGLVKRLRMPDGSVGGVRNTACEVGDDTRGDISFVDCHIEGFPDNGLYANPPEGRVRVIGGYYANNGISNVRVNADAGSVVRGVHVRCDKAPDGFNNMRGIRLRGGNDILVEDCLVELLDATYSDGAVTFSSQLESATMRNCRIRVDADDVNAIRIKRPIGPAVRNPGGKFHIHDVDITGSASGNSAIHVNYRDDCVFERICVHQPGRNRGGVNASNVNGSISDTHLAVTDPPYHFQNSDIELHDVSVYRFNGQNPDTVDGRCE